MNCDWCSEPIEGRSLLPNMHRECAFRAVAGSAAHQLRECSCYGGEREDPPGLTKREAARLAFDTARILWGEKPEWQK